MVHRCRKYEKVLCKGARCLWGQGFQCFLRSGLQRWHLGLHGYVHVYRLLCRRRGYAAKLLVTRRLNVPHALLGAACKPPATSNLKMKAHQTQHLLAHAPAHRLVQPATARLLVTVTAVHPANSMQPVQEQRRKTEAQALHGRHLGGNTLTPRGDSFLYSPHEVGAHVSLRSKIRPQQPLSELPEEMPSAARHRALLQSGERPPVRAEACLRAAACGMHACCYQLSGQLQSGNSSPARLGRWLADSCCLCQHRAVHLHCTALCCCSGLHMGINTTSLPDGASA